MKSRKTRIGIFVVFALQCRVQCPSVAFFIIYLCPPGKYSSETMEKLTFSYTFLYCEKQFRYLILICMFPIAGACTEFFYAVLKSAELPFCLFSILWTRVPDFNTPPHLQSDTLLTPAMHRSFSN